MKVNKTHLTNTPKKTQFSNFTKTQIKEHTMKGWFKQEINPEDSNYLWNTPAGFSYPKPH